MFYSLKQGKGSVVYCNKKKKKIYRFVRGAGAMLLDITVVFTKEFKKIFKSDLSNFAIQIQQQFHSQKFKKIYPQFENLHYVAQGRG